MKKMIALGSALTLGLAMASTSASAATVDFKLGYSTPTIPGSLGVADIQDNLLISGSLANTNYYTANLSARSDRVNVIRYKALNEWADNVTAMLAPGEFIQVTGATLNLWLQSYDRPNDITNTVELRQVAAANADFDTQEATWNQKANGVPWAGSAGLQTPGTDYIDTLLDSKTITMLANEANEGEMYGFDVTAAVVQGWIDDASTNAGLLLSGTGTGTLQFFHSEASSGLGLAPFRPQLVVDYEIVPEPASAALLLCGGALMLRRRATR